MLSTVKREALTPEGDLKAEPGHIVLLKRIGSTNYKVAVHFSESSTETMNDKILRLVQSEAAMGPPQNRRFCGERRSDGVSELSRPCGSEGYEVRDDEVAGE